MKCRTYYLNSGLFLVLTNWLSTKTIQQIVARAGEITASNLECMKQYYLASQAGASI